jgi:hypothetical protein
MNQISIICCRKKKKAKQEQKEFSQANIFTTPFCCLRIIRLREPQIYFGRKKCESDD